MNWDLLELSHARFVLLRAVWGSPAAWALASPVELPCSPSGSVHCSPTAALRAHLTLKEMLKQGTQVNECKTFEDSMLSYLEEGFSPS